MIKRSLIILWALAALLSCTASAQSTSASEALFVRSDSARARTLAQQVLAKHPKDIDASFILMEAAALQDDAAAILDAAATIVQNATQDDPRLDLAIARIRSLASNSQAFRERAATVKALSKDEPTLRAANVSAASDGLDFYEMLAESRDAGLITDWRIAGPFGERSTIDLQKRWAPETDGLRKATSGRKKVESLQFPNGLFSLPAYMTKQGVYYAAGGVYVDSTGDWNLYLETAGLATLTLDGRPVIVRDGNSSFNRTEKVTLHLTQGDHQVLMKFNAAASPFRVALLPPSGGTRKKRKFPVATSAESDYVMAALEYWRGDLVAAARKTQRLRATQPSAITSQLMADIWRAASDESPEVLASELDASERDPNAAKSLLWIAEHDIEAENFESALKLLRRAVRIQPRSEQAARVESELMSRLRWQPEATAAYERWIEIHPSCRALQRESEYFASVHDFGRARAAETHLSGCSPDSLALAEALGAHGDHRAAADTARSIGEKFPLNRPARETEIREALLAGDFERAHRRATELVALAPNMAAANELLVQAKARSEFPNNNNAKRRWLDDVIAKLHRDAPAILRQTAQSKVTGSTVVLLDDEAVLEHAGERWHYRHRITRLKTRESILSHGEVNLPSGASVLTLRSISNDGEFSEPELSPHKTTISMPLLAPGSAIEEEYIWRGTTGADFRFSFGSFDAPIAISRFTLISDAGTQTRNERGAPAATVEHLADGSDLSRWERSDIVQSSKETAMTAVPVLPAVLVTSTEKSLTQQRLDIAESMMEAASPGPRTSLLADTLHSSDEFETVRRVYNAAMTQVRNDGATLDAANPAPAEDSLQDGEGSRAAVLLALAQQAQVHVELFALPRQSDLDVPTAYDRPVAVFYLQDGRQLMADLDSDGLPLGSISPELARENALPILAADSRGLRLSDGPLVNLQQPEVNQESTAKGDIWIEPNGTLRATVDITMGAWRGAQLRQSLRGMSAGARQNYFQQLATRLFPGCGDARGIANDEESVERPLQLHVECSAEEFVEVHQGTVELDSVMPALALKNLYGSALRRKYPLYVGTVLDETTEYQLHLPPKMELTTKFQKDLKTPFGRYSYSVTKQDDRTWKLVRSFKIPIQKIVPERYPDFANFADQSQRIEETKLEIAAQ
jgi:hypothetical protein